MTMRIEQAKLWRQDVRDLVSLTEYKMHLYLVVNVLVLGFTIFLYTEGRLPPGTPYWLMMANIISIGAAFMFLLLSIWLAMHAAISAQSFEARLLTQMVRLPVPTWEECEATRTFGSEFEKVEGRQMFRVPWLMGWQENLVGSLPQDVQNTATSDIEAGADTAETTPDVTADAQTASAQDRNVDPWGLEQAAENIAELGCSFGSDVAKLRHVKLARQAGIQWQTFDAFSRISMSIGVQQLMMAMSYYMLGYLLVQVGSDTSALLGVIVFSMTAGIIMGLDMSLAVGQLRLAQLLLFLGPTCGTIAAFLWKSFSERMAEFVVPIAFVCHGLYFALIAAFSRVRVAENGAWLPVAFRSVLYLDVFSWTRGQASTQIPQRTVAGVDDTQAQVGRPALQAIRYVDGRPVPLRPEDVAPAVTQDLRHADGAPDITRPAVEMEAKDEEFYNPSSFLADYDFEDEEDLSERKHGWSEKMGPGEMPWRIFCVAMLLVATIWLVAAVYCVHGAKTEWSLDLPTADIRVATETHRRQSPWVGPKDSETFNGALVAGAAIGPGGKHDDMNGLTSNQLDDEAEIWKHLRLGNAPESMQWDPWTLNTVEASPSEKSISFLVEGAAHRALGSKSLEQIRMSWPWPNISPNRLSCDSTGNHFVMADRILMFSARVDSEFHLAGEPQRLLQKPHAQFSEFDCPAVLGEGLEDIAVSCNSTSASEGVGSCEVLALHGHGRRLASCALALAGHDGESGVGKIDDISSKWLENSQNKHAAEGRMAPSQIEKALSVSISPECNGVAGAETCMVLGTTHGRVVQLGRHSNSRALIPTEVLYEHRENSQPLPGSGLVRSFNRKYLGVLQPNQNSIRVLDLGKGGLAAGTLQLPLSKPVSSFCAGGGHVYMLTNGPEPELWRMAVPVEMMPTPVSIPFDGFHKNGAYDKHRSSSSL
jgi:hypothetical protein